MNKTTNYQLNQWERADRVKMEDFNADNAKIDAALKAEANARATAVNAINTTLSGMVKLAAGSYTGDGAATRIISTGFTPKAVYVCTEDGLVYSNSYHYGGLALPDSPAGGTKTPTVEIVSGGFQVFYASFSSWTNNSNGKNTAYHYIAFA